MRPSPAPTWKDKSPLLKNEQKTVSFPELGISYPMQATCTRRTIERKQQHNMLLKRIVYLLDKLRRSFFSMAFGVRDCTPSEPLV